MKVALVYDRVNKFGGAERVLLALHKIFPDAPLYTSVYDPASAGWAECFKVSTSFLQKLPLPKNAHEFYPFLMGIAFESFNFDEYDLVISVTHEFAKAIITKPSTTHLCYCLNPVGYLWDSYDDYFHSKPGWFKKLSLPVIKYLRFYDKTIANRPDKYLTISKTVQDRIKRIYGKDSKVIYPPVEIKGLAPIESGLAVSGERLGNYFLIVSRLVPQKRIDIAIEAFNDLKLPLKIIGTGKEFVKLKKIAKNNIEFLGYLPDEEVEKYFAGCKAVIIPGEEDFNLVAVEAQSYGKPVIAYGKGGVTETVLPGRTGWFFYKQTGKELAQLVFKVLRLELIEKINREDCIEQAKKFSFERFQKELTEYVRHI